MPAFEGLKLFESEEFGKDRVVQGEDGESWFVAKDVCDVLGLGNPTHALNRLDEDEKNTITISKGIPGEPRSYPVVEQTLLR